MKKQIGWVVAVVVVMCVLPARAQQNSSGSTKDRGPELNLYVSRMGFNAAGTPLPAGIGFGVGFEYPLFQTPRFTLSSGLIFMHESSGTGKFPDAGVSLHASRNYIAPEIIAYFFDRHGLRLGGVFDMGYGGNRFSVTTSDGQTQKQNENAFIKSLGAVIKYDIGKKLSLGFRPELTFGGGGYNYYTGQQYGTKTHSKGFTFSLSYRFGQ